MFCLWLPWSVLKYFSRRWLVHCIAGYYGLQSWSVTEGNPKMRYAYVSKTGAEPMEAMPKPLYLML